MFQLCRNPQDLASPHLPISPQVEALTGRQPSPPTNEAKSSERAY